MASKFKYIDGHNKARQIVLTNIGPRVLWPIDRVALDLVAITGKDYAWAVNNIIQTERMSGIRLPSVWFPGTFGLQCDVLYYDAERIILKNASTVYELINTKG